MKLMDLLLKDGDVDRAALLPSELQVHEHTLEVIDPVLCLVLEKPV